MPFTEDGALAAIDMHERDLMPLAPPLFHELVPSGVPLRALIILAYRFGGTTLYIPAKAGVQSKLAKYLHADEMQALCSVAGREYLEIPRATQLRRELRNRWVMRLLDSGESKSDVALKAQVTQRCVYSIARNFRERARKQLNQESPKAAPARQATLRR